MGNMYIPLPRRHLAAFLAAAAITFPVLARAQEISGDYYDWTITNKPERPWLPGRLASLPYPFGPNEILPLMDNAGVDRCNHEGELQVILSNDGSEGKGNGHGLTPSPWQKPCFRRVASPTAMPVLRQLRCHS